MRAYREEAVRQLVLALRTGLEALQALRYRVFGAEVVAQMGSPPRLRSVEVVVEADPQGNEILQGALRDGCFEPPLPQGEGDACCNA